MTRPISELPQFIKDLLVDMQDVLFITAESIRLRMAEPGKPSTSPVNWDGEKDPIKGTTKQQRWWFANNELPYHRTDDYIRSWAVERIPMGVALVNPFPAAGAVSGMPNTGWQSKIHRGRWNYLPQILSEELSKLPDRIRNKFQVRSRNE